MNRRRRDEITWLVGLIVGTVAFLRETFFTMPADPTLVAAALALMGFSLVLAGKNGARNGGKE